MLSVFEQVLIRVGARPNKEQLEEYATALVLALAQVIGGRSAAAGFVKNRLTSYAQRREVIVQIVNSMRTALNDASFGQRIDPETPMERRVAETERKLAGFIASTLGIESMKDLRQKAPEEVWRAVQSRSQGGSTVPLHEWITLGEIKQIMGRQDHKDLLIARLTDAGSDFRNEAEILVALDGLIEWRNALQHGRTAGHQPLGEAYLSAFERFLDRV